MTSASGSAQILSLDERICGNAAELGFDVVPAA